ncbi:DUF4400 domain-containing protein [Vibrio sp. Y2-5]|uniref:DUF4400 domain-containing protein n=1 Tax=Vibrio sp. Y2-5 TaxID=2743977 RepID=UPI0016606EA8|nr:DUF4400 domain-containing protein [Vibrio sp. Y2-5]MBD0788028.1 DUF4400 domain-containing protein [Vibrio sp. Y2-5]
MADTTTNNTSNNPNTPKRRQDIPLITTVLATFGRYFSLCILAGGVSVVLSIAIYSYFFFLGDNNYRWSLNIYKEMLVYQESLGKWLDVKEVFTVIVTYIQDKLSGISSIDTGIFNSFLTSKHKILDYSFEFSNIYDEKVTAENGAFFGTFRQSGDYFYNLAMTVLLMTMVWLLKILTIVNYLPVYLLSICFGLSNGLTQRKVATFKGELDFQDRTELVYRKLRMVSITVLFTYVSIPYGVNPLWVFVPSVVLTGISVRYLAALYKKYY